MKWLLVINLLSPVEDDLSERFSFETRAECLAAAQAFVEEYPGVELRDHVDSLEVEPPVLRSYVECMPEEYMPGEYDPPEEDPP